MQIELHVIQNFAPSCLNRDDTNSPKDCEFGGFRRARISSQCIKRAARMYFDSHADELRLNGNLAKRTKLLVDELTKLLVKKGRSDSDARSVARGVVESSGLKVEDDKTSVLLFLGTDEMQRLADHIHAGWDSLQPAAPSKMSESDEKGKKAAKAKKSDKKAEGSEGIKKAMEVLKAGTRAADVALFGRMVAEVEGMNVDAACQVAHAISTQEVDMEMDFYTAVDDLQPREDTGAGMMGIVEFNSSCFYRYAVLDHDQLVRNLGGDHALAKAAALAFLKASVEAIPSGKQHSMAAHNLPVYVRAICRESGAPRSLANAFLTPVRVARSAKEDLAQASIRKLEEHEEALRRMYGAGTVACDERRSVYTPSGDMDSLFGKIGDCLK